MSEEYVKIVQKSTRRMAEVTPEEVRVARELEVELFYIRCPVCGVRIYGFSESGAKARLREHLKEYHEKPPRTWTWGSGKW